MHRAIHIDGMERLWATEIDLTRTL